MYVLVVFGRWDEENVDCVLGPFDTLEAAQDSQEYWFPQERGWRRTSIQRVRSDVPEHAR